MHLEATLLFPIELQPLTMIFDAGITAIRFKSNAILFHSRSSKSGVR